MVRNRFRKLVCIGACVTMIFAGTLTVCAEETEPAKTLDIQTSPGHLRIDANGMTPTEFQAALQGLSQEQTAAQAQEVEANRQAALARGIDLSAAPKKVMDGNEYSATQVTPNGTYIYAEYFADAAEAKIFHIASKPWPDIMLNAIDAAGITNDMSDYDKCVAINNYICNTLEYGSDGDDYRGDHIGVDLENTLINKKGVCKDYANLFQNMCYMVGVDCDCVGGWATNDNGRGPHDWNRVFIDGTAYYVDSTWNDTEYHPNRYFMSTTIWPTHEMTGTDRVTTNGK